MVYKCNYCVNLILITLYTYLDSVESTITMMKYEYIGKRNVWHEGTKWHTVIFYKKFKLLFLKATI